MLTNAFAVILALSAVMAAPATAAQRNATKPFQESEAFERGAERIPDMIVRPEDEKRTEGPRSTGRITIGPNTEVHVVAILGSRMKELLGGADGRESALKWAVEDAIGDKLKASGRQIALPYKRSRFPSSPDKIGEAIIVYLEIDYKPNSDPYRVSLIGVQGTKVWSASLERPYYIRLNMTPGPDKDGRLFDGTPYWDPLRDTSELAEQFASSIRVTK